MQENYKLRFKDISWAKIAPDYNILVIGLGGIGSWLSLLLNRAGYNTILVDFDRVEAHNIGGQLFMPTQGSLYKTEAVVNTVHSFCEIVPSAITEKYTPNFFDSIDIIAVCVDSMEVRQQIFDDWKKVLEQNKANPSLRLPIMLVDGRLNAEQFTVYAVTEETVERYSQTMYKDNEVPDDICTNKQTSHFGAGIAYTMTKLINCFVANRADDLRDLPFCIKDEGFLMTQQVEP